MARTAITTIPRLPVGGVFIKNAGMEFEAGTTSTANAFVGTQSGLWQMYESGTATVSYDNVVFNSALGGLQSIKVEISAPSAGFYNASIGTSATLANLIKYGIRIKPSTSYTLTFYYKMTGMSSTATFDRQEHSVAGGARTLIGQTSLGSADVDWTLKTVTWTSNASSAYLLFQCYSGGTGTYWIDDITLKETTPSARTTAAARNVASARNPVV